jgi:hypothetical protein
MTGDRVGDDMEPVSVCVLCGAPWEPSVKNRCECGGFCTWGPAKGADPDSWIVTDKGWVPKPSSHADPEADR